MRQLDPQVAQERKRKVLQWAVHHHIRTSRPIASSNLAEEAGLDLSSATLRSILKELEDEGFLHQPHTSSGRVPTDRGYRFYVDYLQDVQRLAAQEKAQIESQYRNRMEELDLLLAQTSRLLSRVTHSTGLVLSPKMEKQTLKRLELIPLGPNQVLAIVVTNAGQVRHWPIRLSFAPSRERIQMLNRFLNEHVEGLSIREVQSTLSAQIEKAERELRELHGLARELLSELGGASAPEELYLEGATSLVERAEEIGDPRQLQSLMRVFEERQAIARMLHEEFERAAEDAVKGKGKSSRAVSVRIGAENLLPELKNLSLVTTVYTHKDQVVGVLGILGSRRMEYARMMSLVDYMGRMVSRTLEAWDPGSEEPNEGRKGR
ncbi:MAG TPA: heat-inducible transcriptional repressor HrcA [Elusimicrobiota bacterium]|nr:heat-inducible transcriptional repressor HrcA [Elusimicrobiota bacterium]